MDSFKSLILLALVVVVLNHDTSFVRASVIDISGLLGDNGTSEYTALQKHCSFFDRNKDGLIYPKETYEGLRALGVSKAVALFSSVFVFGQLGPKTQPGNESTKASLLSAESMKASILSPIYIENIKRTTHPSIKSAYDSEGRFVASNFEGFFTKFAKTNPNYFTKDELTEMANDVQIDNPDKFAGQGWKTVYDIFKDKDGLLQKDAVRDLYDGTLFYKKEKELASSA